MWGTCSSQPAARLWISWTSNHQPPSSTRPRTFRHHSNAVALLVHRHVAAVAEHNLVVCRCGSGRNVESQVELPVPGRTNTLAVRHAPRAMALTILARLSPPCACLRAQPTHHYWPAYLSGHHRTQRRRPPGPPHAVPAHRTAPAQHITSHQVHIYRLHITHAVAAAASCTVQHPARHSSQA